MKANRNFGILKAIAFITVVFFFVACCPDEPVLTKASVEIYPAENITDSSATLVASVIANQPGTVASFSYQENNSSTWKSQVVATDLSGDKVAKITLNLEDLQPSTSYNFKVIADNAAGQVSSYVISFTTKGLAKSVIKLNQAEKVGLNSARLTAWVTPNQNPTTAVLKYKKGNSDWQSQPFSRELSGKDSIRIAFDILDLQVNTLYSYEVETTNKAGVVTSTVSSFTTYAVSDYDGNLYHAITIGTQTWLKENFKGTHYANGDPIPNVTDAATWSTLTTGAYCYYNNDSKNGETYGALYNFYVGTDPRGLIVGWHVPVGDEFAVLSNYLGGYSQAGIKVMEAGNTHWENTISKATNSSGFTALPGGDFGGGTNFNFVDLNKVACFWASDLFGPGASAAIIDASNCGLSIAGIYSPKFGFSLRLLKN